MNSLPRKIKIKFLQQYLAIRVIKNFPGDVNIA